MQNVNRLLFRIYELTKNIPLTLRDIIILLQVYITEKVLYTVLLEYSKVIK